MFKWARVEAVTTLTAVLVALLSASGCCCGPCGPKPCGPLGLGLICKPGCGTACGPHGGRHYGAHPGAHYGPGPGAACGPACGPTCGPTCCAPSLTCSPCGGGLKYWLNGRCFCGPSCCDRYWGEWISDPPHCCDPCNQCGHFVGPKCCGPGPLMRLWSVVACGPCARPCGPGLGYGACQGCATGCSSCAGGGHMAGPGIMHENWEHHGPAPVPGQNIHQAGQPTPAVRSVQYSQQVSPPTPARSAMSRQVPQGGMMMRR